MLLAAAGLAPSAGASATGAHPPQGPLDLGPAGLVETRTTEAVQPGVTLTRITRGAADPAVRWVVEVSIPGGSSSPDPDAPPRAVQDEASARAHAARLTAAGFPAQAEQVDQPAVADVPAGVLGWRVRLTADVHHAGRGERRDGPARGSRVRRTCLVCRVGRHVDGQGSVDGQRRDGRPAPVQGLDRRQLRPDPGEARDDVLAGGLREGLGRDQRRVLRVRPGGRRRGRPRGCGCLRRPPRVRAGRVATGPGPRPAGPAHRGGASDVACRGDPPGQWPPGARRPQPGARPDPQLWRHGGRPAHAPSRCTT